MKRPFLLLVLVMLMQWPLMASNWLNVSADTIVVETDSIVHNPCFGESLGMVFLHVQANLTVSFTWSNGDTLQNISGLAAGYYSVTVSDTTGSQAVLDSILVGQPDQLDLNFSDVLHPDCNGALGALTVHAHGGTPGYSYLWSTGDTLSSIDSLVAGVYDVTITDQNGCQAFAAFDLQPLYPFVSLISDGDINCLQSVVVLDGSNSLQDHITFQWSAGTGGHFASAIDTLVVAVDSAGEYTLTVSDTLTGCSSESVVNVLLDTIPPSVNVGPDTTMLCSNTVIGLTAQVSNSVSSTFQWEASNGGIILNGATTDSITISSPGLYTLHVTNLDNGCVAIDSILVDALHLAPTASVEDGELNCYLPTTTLSAVSDTLDRVFQWSGPNGYTSNELNPLAIEGGVYTLLVVDTITTCSASFSLEINDNTEGPSLVLTGGELNCNIVAVAISSVTTSGDAVYAWSGPNGFSSILQNPVVAEAGSYTLVLTDTLTGCTSVDSVVVAIDTLPPSIVIATTDILTCESPIISIDATASTSVNTSFNWTTIDGNIVAGASTSTPQVDAAGTYLLTLTNTENGCTATEATIVLAEFTTPVVSVVGGIFNCFDGGVQIIGVFDTAGVTFNWEGPNGFTSNVQNPFVTVGGDYILTVTNLGNGCSVTETAQVIQLGETPILTVAVSDTITCDTPMVQLTVSAQIGGIDWSWSGPDNFASTDQNPMTGESGWHFVLAIDPLSGCIALDSIFVEIDTLHPVADAGTGLAFDCHTTSTILNGTASSGVGFDFNWSTQDGQFAEGENTLNPTVDQAGTYTLTVSNLLNGCVSTSDVVITQTPQVVAEVSSTGVLCHGEANGTGTVLPGGGVGGYSVAWSSGSLATVVTDLVAGSYTVTVSDQDGCTAEGTITVGEPDVLVANASATGQTLAGIDDGTATANPAGGTAPYTYLWSTGDTTQTIIGLAPGAYPLLMMDANGCTAIETVNVNEFPCTLNSDITGTNVACHGASTGTATVILENAIEPYNFIWSNGDTTATVTNLEAGTYNVLVSDSTLCKNELTITITQPTPIVVTELFHEDVNCPGELNGFVVIGVNGGVQPYTYLWSNGSTTAVAKDLGTGNIEVAVTDRNGCEVAFSTTIGTYDETVPVLILQDITVALDGDGLAILTGSMFDAGTTDNCGEFILSVEPDTLDCSHLGTQTVTIIASDLSGNSIAGTALVEIIDNQAPVLTCPDNIVVSACNPVVAFNTPTVEDNCATDINNLVQTDGLPSGSSFAIGSTTIVYAYTDAGTNNAVCRFEVIVVDSLQAAINVTNATCADACNGSATLSISEGLAPYQVVWSNGEQGLTIDGLCAGDYTATVADASGCGTIEFSVTVAEPDAVALAVVSLENNICAEDQNGSAMINVSGGTGSYTYLWTNGSTDVNLSNVASGSYTLTATDENGCEANLTVEILAQDSNSPVLVLQDAIVALNANGDVTLDASMFDNGSSDDCSIVSWDIFPVTFDCNRLGEHTVTIVATDSNGNSATATATVTVVDNTNPVLTCPSNRVVGFCNTQVVFSAPQISDNCSVIPANLQLVSGLASGSVFPFGVTTQQFGYTDASGNAAMCTFTVTVHAPANVSATVSDLACNGVCDGEVNLELVGNAGPFTITWSNGQTGPSATGLCPGSYNATIVDSDGCLQFFSTVVMEPSSLNINVDAVSNDSNMDGLGAIQISVSGGVTPYTYEWEKDGQPFSTNEDLTGLFAGTYQVVVFDANGCEIESGTIIVQDLVPTKNTYLNDAVKVAPNPASQWTKLTLPQPSFRDATINLYDSLGKLGRTYTMAKGQSEVQLDLTGIATGFYTIKLQLNDEMIVKTLVVE